MSIEAVEQFQNEMLQKLQDKIKELDLYSKENYTKDQFACGSALMVAFTALESDYDRFLDSVKVAEELLEVL